MTALAVLLTALAGAACSEITEPAQPEIPTVFVGETSSDAEVVATVTKPPVPQPEGPTVIVGDTAFDVEIAATAAEREQGLSGRDELAPGDGMLFVYAAPSVLTFWMKDMLLPLDFVWIGAGCTVVDITHDVPNPPRDAAPAALPRYSSASPASYNLEINAGEARRFGLSEGDPVSFVGIEAESAKC